MNETSPQETRKLCEQILDEIERAVVGRRDALSEVLLTVLVGGHILLEDLPGLGKTLIARSFATTLGLTFARVQFTPDLLPGDLTGTSLYDPGKAEFSFRPGPVFTQLLLADEINRTPPKTQAALLEAMGERQVSSDGVTRRLPDPFVVLATENPIEYEGTYPLPEAQLDRFTTRVTLGYLSIEREIEVMDRRVSRRDDEVELSAVVDADMLRKMRASVESVHVHRDVLDYVARLLQATRDHPEIAVGASSRAGLALTQVARARALLDGRGFVLADDVKASATTVLAHRLSLKPELWVRRVTGIDIMTDLLTRVPVPQIEPE